MKEYHLKYNNYNICIYENGKGEIPIVLLHGAGLDSTMLSWKEVINLLSNNLLTKLEYINDYFLFSKNAVILLTVDISSLSKSVG